MQAVWSEGLTRWSNAKAGLVGYLTGKGMMAPQIALAVGDGVLPETIRAMWRHWDLPLEGQRSRCTVPVPVALTRNERKALVKVANKRGLKAEELLRRVAVAVIDDAMYDAVIDES